MQFNRIHFFARYLFAFVLLTAHADAALACSPSAGFGGDSPRAPRFTSVALVRSFLSTKCT